MNFNKEGKIIMKNNILLTIKGMIIGIANVIPGVSGGTLMITLGIYEQIIDTISHFFKNIKKNLKFIIPLGIGIGLSILLFSKLIGYSRNKFPFATTFFFIGLILGGIPLLWRKVKIKSRKISNWLIFFLTFTLVVVFAFLKSGSNMVSFRTFGLTDVLLIFLVGVIAASTMIIPGISGSFVLMLLGYYEPIINTISNITDFSLLGQNLLILVPFGIGIFVGIVLVAKLIEYLFKKFETKTYFGVLGFVLASLVAILKPIININVSIVEMIIAIVLAIGGFIGAYKLEEK